MTIVTPTTSWSGGIATGTKECPVQCQAGYVLINWGSGGAPSSTLDGLELGPGETMVIPAGQTWYHTISSTEGRPGTTPRVFYELFE